MNKQTSGKAALLISLLASAPIGAQTSGRDDGMRFLPDVPGQFRALTERADPLGFHISTTPNPSACRHYQAITRVDGADGTPFFLVTRSGNLPDTDFIPDGLVCDDSPGETGNGHLIVFRMDSREKHGERMRSNRLRQGMHVNNTPPPPEDIATIYFTVVGGIPSDPDPARRPGLVLRDGEPGVALRVYQHPGGMQLVGHMLAIALETPRFPLGPCDFLPPPCEDDRIIPDPTLIMFFDVSDPEAPVFKSQFAPHNQAGVSLSKAGVVAVTPLPGGLYLMAVTGGKTNETLFFYRSTLGDLASPDLSWEFVGTTPGPDVQDAHQTLQFLREGNINGPLYLAGARSRVLSIDRDRIDLYRVECDTPDCAPGENISLTVRFNGQRITTFPSTGGGVTPLANLAAGGGFHVTPTDLPPSPPSESCNNPLSIGG